FQCCGARSYTNWLESAYFQTENPPDPEFASVGSLADGVGSVPSSCCTAKGKRAYKDCGLNFASTGAALHTFVDAKNPEESLIHAKACNDALFEYFDDRSNLIIAIAVGVGCIELVAMVLTMLLCCCINNDKNASKNRYY
uniref:Tetraspanin n=1 Tax=Romanomermis culicivorax TaxID=13658 RepID=A0A915KDM5_ROMCU